MLQYFVLPCSKCLPMQKRSPTEKHVKEVIFETKGDSNKWIQDLPPK